MKQLTLKDSFTLNGKGLHTGAQIEATFCPAADNHGYKIQRVDLENQPVIDALAENIVATTRGTVIGKGDVTVSTIEHAMAALYAAGIDNCLIKVNAPELPILDGSAKPYVDEIERVGVVEQNDDKDYYIVKHKIEVADEKTGSKIMILPDDEFSVEVKVNFESPVLSNQYASMEHIDSFATEIAPSRTFVFVREIEPLVTAGLIKGGDLDNAIVIYDSELPQERIDHIADLMNSPRREVKSFGYVNTRPL
ncbi:MAG: UDP-3-O-acyl-N-acetylglucosamine deacetylase, partial [Muribaculaceae bacterium]|nr:UDP-3-O-acyl-N-acetylglucosamine deacetylase [Muribaculaceae bacterium]